MEREMTTTKTNTPEPTTTTPEHVDERMYSTLASAMLRAQAILENPPKNRTATVKHKNGGQHSYKYADLADVNKAIMPVLNEFGLVVMQTTDYQNNQIMLITKVIHAATNECIEGVYPVCPVNVPPQEAGSAMTYARRYALCALVNITAEDDLDGGTEGHARMSKQGGRDMYAAVQEELRVLIVGRDPQAVHEWVKANADRLSILPNDWELQIMADARKAYTDLSAQEDLDRNTNDDAAAEDADREMGDER
jgi:glutamyl/glutaminyl-tRNA synthetase